MDIIPGLLSLNVRLFNSAFKIKRVVYRFNPLLFPIRRRGKKMPCQGLGKDLIIILNGPSLKEQNLNVLKQTNKSIMFVNRGFMHPDYVNLQPDYHVFVDSKLRDGEWPIEWVEKIFSMCPNIKIVFPIEWYRHPTFKKYKSNKQIIWQDWHVPFYCLGVSGACFSFGIEHKFDNIFFTGFDANGCAHDMINSSNSHFYGGDPELSNMTTIQHARAMCSTAIHFIDLNRLSDYCRKRSIHIYNLTAGGLLDMFDRKKMEDIV